MFQTAVRIRLCSDNTCYFLTSFVARNLDTIEFSGFQLRIKTAHAHSFYKTILFSFYFSTNPVSVKLVPFCLRVKRSGDFNTPQNTIWDKAVFHRRLAKPHYRYIIFQLQTLRPPIRIVDFCTITNRLATSIHPHLLNRP